MATQNIKLDLPEKYQDKNVLLKIEDSKTSEKPIQKFRSFSINIVLGTGCINVKNKAILIRHLFELLQKHGLPSTIPISVILHDSIEFWNFDWTPLAYNGPRVWYFTWEVKNGEDTKTIQCSLTGDCHHLYIRVHDMTPGIGEIIMNDITSELYKYYVPALTGTLDIYTTQLTHSGYNWEKNCTKVHRDMSTIYLNPEIKDKIVTKLKNFLQSSHIYDKYGRTWKRVHLFHGPPGSGKTSTVLALASLFQYHIAKLTVTPQMNSQHIERLFNSLPAKTFLLLEDVDSLFVERTSTGSVDFSTLLQCMDGLTTKRGLVLFMTTNHLKKLDSAFIRPGRVDLSVEFHLPGKAELAAALKVLGADYASEHEKFLEMCPANMTIASLQEHLFNCIMEEKKTILELGEYLG